MDIKVFTDGSFIKNKNIIKCGYGIHFPNGEFKDIAKPFTKLPKTNQRAELYAIYKAIKHIYKHDKNNNITIFTDSEYSIKSLTEWITIWKNNNWKTSSGKDVLNQDIIRKIDMVMDKHLGKINFIHVKAHTNKTDYNSIHNDLTDALAKKGANMI
jgi:ribonuclease HI